MDPLLNFSVSYNAKKDSIWFTPLELFPEITQNSTQNSELNTSLTSVGDRRVDFLNLKKLESSFQHYLS